MKAYLSAFRMRRRLELQYRGAVLGGVVCHWVCVTFYVIPAYG